MTIVACVIHIFLTRRWVWAWHRRRVWALVDVVQVILLYHRVGYKATDEVDVVLWRRNPFVGLKSSYRFFVRSRQLVFFCFFGRPASAKGCDD